MLSTFYQDIHAKKKEIQLTKFEYDEHNNRRKGMLFFKRNRNGTDVYEGTPGKYLLYKFCLS